MHPAFQLARLSEFPSLVLRRLATEAASGSEPAMREFARCMRRQLHVDLFLPVLWANLDPDRMPETDALDAVPPHPDTVHALQLALCAIETVTLLKLKGTMPGVYAELWLRIWVWMEVLQVYHPLLPKPIAALVLRSRFLDVIWDILHDPVANLIIHATPNVYAFIALSWTGLELEFASDLDRLRFEAVSHFVTTSDWDPENLQEFVDGAGGAQPLARLVVQHIQARGIPSLDTETLDAIDTLWLSRLFLFVDRLHSVELKSALLDAGIVPVLTTTLIPLSRADSMGRALPDALDNCLTVLVNFACLGARYAHIPAALDAGLLRAIVLLSAMHIPGVDVNAHLRYWLRDILPGATIYYPVLHAMQYAIETAVELSVENRFQASPIFEDWLAFRDVASDRTKRLNEFNSPSYLSLKFCDNYNRTCKTIKRAGDIKCCSGCRVAHYCSSECQRAAWKGGHREICQALQLHPRSRPRHFQSRRIDEGFLKHVVLQDYKTHKTDILRRQINFVRANPGVRFCTLFAYALGRCKIAVFGVDELPAEQRPAMSELAGRTQTLTGLHHVVINRQRPFAFDYVLRSSNSLLEDGVLRLAALKRPATKEEVAMLSRSAVIETY
ncbi:hypothetical protein C8R46DRAFT_1308937 [Mycena filopes]|nr:hypothetical protein C8R46DRAFT_1308937 [Mycena filopes]